MKRDANHADLFQRLKVKLLNATEQFFLNKIFLSQRTKILFCNFYSRLFCYELKKSSHSLRVTS